MESLWALSGGSGRGDGGVSACGEGGRGRVEGKRGRWKWLGSRGWGEIGEGICGMKKGERGNKGEWEGGGK